MTIKTVTFTLNGVVSTLGYDSSSGTYKGTITAPSSTSGSHNSGQGPGVGANAAKLGYYPASVSVTDTAGNVTTVDSSDSTFGTILRLKVEETTAPVVTIDTPGASARLTSSKPSIQVTATDSGSGVQAIYLQVDSGTATSIGGATTSSSSTVTYTPTTALAEGEHTIKAYAVDYDGNTSETVSRTFFVDTIAPSLNVTSPADALLTNSTTVTVAGTTNDATSSPVTISIKVGSQSYSPTVTDGAFSQAVTLSAGSNTITITATDSAGLTTTVTRTVTLDTTAPSITKIEISPNPVDAGKSYIVTVTVTDA